MSVSLLVAYDLLLKKFPILQSWQRNPCLRYFLTLFTVTMRTSDSNDGSYGFFLGLEKSARWSFIENHFSCYCVPQKFSILAIFLAIAHLLYLP